MLDEFISLIRQWVGKGIYVWGGQGETITSEAQIRRMETSTANADRAIRLWKSRGSNAVAFDCSGLIVWALQELKLIDYDTTANGMYRMAESIGKADLRVGDLVFRVDTDGRAYHVGVVTRPGYVTEARGRDYGVVEEKIDNVNWNRFGRNPWIKGDKMALLKVGSRGDEVKILQTQLNQLGYDAGKADGIFGTRTDNAVRAFQRASNITVDGIVGDNTRLAIEKALTPKDDTAELKAEIKRLTELNSAKDAQIQTMQAQMASLNATLSAQRQELVDVAEVIKTLNKIAGKY